MKTSPETVRLPETHPLREIAVGQRSVSSPSTGRPISALLRDTQAALASRPASVQLQRTIGNAAIGRLLAQSAPRPNRTGLPDRLKTGIEALSGLAMDDVRVHANSPLPARADALAYASGNDIHLAPGQESHLPHEAWHVVQQKQGRVRPTLQSMGLAINDDPLLERDADVMGARAMATERKAAAVLPAPSLQGKTIQRQPNSFRANTGTVTLEVGDTGAFAYLINGTVTSEKTAIPAKGNIRYLRTNGVFDCIAVAMQGTRTADGAVVSLLAHLSGKEYLQDKHVGRPVHAAAFREVAKFSEGLTDVRSLAATTHQRSSLRLAEAMKPEMRGVPLHKVDASPVHGGDFILDSEQFNLQTVGQENERHGAELGKSVSTYLSQQRYEELYPVRKKPDPKRVIAGVIAF